VKADPAVQRRLLDLSEVDTQLSQLEHRRRRLPELAEIDELEKETRAKRDAVVAAETTLGDLDRDAARLETEVDQVRAREDRDRKLMDAGNLGSKQLADLEHELQTLQRRQSALEDDLLDVMERREAVEADLSRDRAALEEVRQRLSSANGRRDEALRDLEVAEARRNEDRKTLIDGLPAELVVLYDRLRSRGGAGAALLQSRRCGACRLELDRTVLARLRGASPDEVVRCEECGAILVRTSESGL
jgi:uncharacterized protein